MLAGVACGVAHWAAQPARLLVSTPCRAAGCEGHSSWDDYFAWLPPTPTPHPTHTHHPTPPPNTLIFPPLFRQQARGVWPRAGRQHADGAQAGGGGDRAEQPAKAAVRYHAGEGAAGLVLVVHVLQPPVLPCVCKKRAGGRGRTAAAGRRGCASHDMTPCVLCAVRRDVMAEALAWPEVGCHGAAHRQRQSWSLPIAFTTGIPTCTPCCGASLPNCGAPGRFQPLGQGHPCKAAALFAGWRCTRGSAKLDTAPLWTGCESCTHGMGRMGQGIRKQRKGFIQRRWKPGHAPGRL